MKKWLIGLIVPALIGTAPFGAYAAGRSDCTPVKYYQGVITIRQQQPQKDPVQLTNGYEKGWRKDSGNSSLALNHRDRRRLEKNRHEDRQRKKERDDARYVINRTASVISRAQRSTKIGHFYNGIARSIAHQNKARELYRAGRYRDAIFHSLRARKLAMNVIRGNRDNWAGYSRDEREERYARMSPKDKDLDVLIDWSKVGKDNTVVHIQFNLSVD